jgi:uncharacterized protein YndB with AHSA1/START domain
MTGTATAVEVSAVLAAAPEDVYPYFTDPARHVQWMGSDVVLDPVPGGSYRVGMPDGFRAAGTFLRVDPPHQLTFSWGFADADAAQRTKHEQATGPLPPGSTQVTVTLEAADGGTRLTLRHDGLPTRELQEAHRVAWGTYLPRLAVRVAGGDPGPDPHAGQADPGDPVAVDSELDPLAQTEQAVPAGRERPGGERELGPVVEQERPGPGRR